MRHIYVGLSRKRVWCGAKPVLQSFPSAPLTEGEYLDGLAHDDACHGCAEAIEPVRGRPVIERGAE